jgi:heme-degrading monooxygenase HmoA
MAITRIVKLSFHLDNVSAFKTIFEESQNAISSFPGCQGVSLMRDIDDKHIFYTYSLWVSNDALQNYRKSDLFITTWAKTKVLFNDKPLAFSLESFSS